jgi:predicted nucleotidyltransferase
MSRRSLTVHRAWRRRFAIIEKKGVPVTRDEVLRILRSHKSVLKERFGIEEMALFGSFSRNEGHEESDVDLAIVKTTKKSYWTLMDVMNYLSDILGREVDVGFYDAIRPFYRRRIEKDMIYV